MDAYPIDVYRDTRSSLAAILTGFSVLAGDEMGESGESWQDQATATAEELRRLAWLLESAASGECRGQVVFPSPADMIDSED